jgi:electron transfer flavoprotein alpha/beta subunit
MPWKKPSSSRKSTAAKSSSCQCRPRAHRPDHPRSPRQGRRPRHPHRLRRPRPRDALSVARLLAAAVKPESPDLLLTGLQSEDLGLGQTGVIVAELLGLPHATLILHVEKTDSGLTVKRELEEGWFQTIELPTPAVLTIQSGGNKLRYATLMGIKRAKTKEVRRVTAADLGAKPRPSSCSTASPCRKNKNPPRSCPAPRKKPPQPWLKS